MSSRLTLRVNPFYQKKKKKERDTAICQAVQSLQDQELDANFDNTLQRLRNIRQQTEDELNKSRANLEITETVSQVVESMWQLHAAEQKQYQQGHIIPNQSQSHFCATSGHCKSGTGTGESKDRVDWTEAGRKLRKLDLLSKDQGRRRVVASLLSEGMPLLDITRRLNFFDLAGDPESRLSRRFDDPQSSGYSRGGESI